MNKLMLIVVVIVTLGLAAGALFPFPKCFESDEPAASAQIKQFRTVLMGYKLKFKKFPSSLDELVNPPSGGSLLQEDSLPKDPWGNAYQYRLEGSSDYEIISLGADGAAGGAEYDADISSKNLSGE